MNHKLLLLAEIRPPATVVPPTTSVSLNGQVSRPISLNHAEAKRESIETMSSESVEIIQPESVHSSEHTSLDPSLEPNESMPHEGLVTSDPLLEKGRKLRPKKSCQPETKNKSNAKSLKDSQQQNQESNTAPAADQTDNSKAMPKNQSKLKEKLAVFPKSRIKMLEHLAFKQSKVSKTRHHKGEFKKVQYKDYIDHGTTVTIDKKLKSFEFESGTITLSASVVGVAKNDNGIETFLIEWLPEN